MGGGVGVGVGVGVELCYLYPIPDHVQLILQPYTRLDTENPYPIPDLLFLELYHYKWFSWNSIYQQHCHDDFYLLKFSSEFWT